MSPRGLMLILLLVGLLVIPAGCGGVTGSYGIHSRESTWSSAAETSVPGLDSASVTCVTAHVDGVPHTFVIWSDLGCGSGGRGSSGVKGAVYRGTHRSQEGDQVEILAEVGADKPLTLKVNGAVLNLTKGKVVLVKATVDPPQMRQLDLDPKLFEKEQPALVELARTTAPIREFFEATDVKSTGEGGAVQP